MDLYKLSDILSNLGEPRFRLKQIKKAVCQEGVSSFMEISTIPKKLRDELKNEIKILSFEVDNILISKDNKSAKASLKLNDGNYIETVLLHCGKDNFTICVSSQAGCPLACAFCATGKNGFKRNLTSEEITDQVLFWKQYIYKNPKIPAKDWSASGGKLSNIVFMGMGEPFLNFENVVKSIKDLINPDLFGFGSRSISVSTAGIPDKLLEFSKIFPQINIAISLHFADNKIRSQFMPINRKYSLESLKTALKNYFKKHKRKIFLEYILFSELNDSLENAGELIKFIKSIVNEYLLHVNLIPYNSTSEKYFKSSSKTQMIKFEKHLRKNNINATIRKSLGTEIQGACGQLAGKS